jgi:hypothetical protein
VVSSRHRAGRPVGATRRFAIPAAVALAVATGLGALVSLDPADDPVDDPAETAPAARPASAPPPERARADERLVRAFTQRTGDRSDVSRAGTRPALQRGSAQATDGPERRKQPELDLTRRWVTTDLNLWSGPGEDHRLLTVLPEGVAVRRTQFSNGPWAQVARENRVAWVRASYLADEKPAPEPPAATRPTPGGGGGAGTGGGAGGGTAGGGEADGSTGSAGGSTGSVSGAACPDGSSVESGLTTSAVALYRAVCAAFPAVSSWGGLRPGDDGYHGTGQALDVMVGTDASLGQAVADYVQANASTLGVSEIIWAQQIWTVDLASQGWRPMEDRGSVTANHYDHVHVSVY